MQNNEREVPMVDQLAEMLATVPEDKQELVAAQLLGVTQGVLLAAALAEQTPA